MREQKINLVEAERALRLKRVAFAYQCDVQSAVTQYDADVATVHQKLRANLLARKQVVTV